MITIANVISIDGYTDFSGSQEIDPANISYLQEDPNDSTKTYLYEEQKGGFKYRVWYIDEAIATIVTNAVTDTGFEVLITPVAGTLSNRNCTDLDGTWTINPARIFQMRDNASDEALIRLWDDNVQGFNEFKLEVTSRDLAAEANTTIQQVENGSVDQINENELTAATTIYWSTALVEKTVPARTGISNLTTPETVYLATYNGQKIAYQIATAGSSS
jgi:hypothetical protein